MSEQHIVVEGITKIFGDLRANDGVGIAVRRGSIHAILGENGAGKSTLMNILYGLYQPDAGRIHINDQQVHIGNPAEALALGIGMVHQHFMLVGTLTVTENIVLGIKGRGLGLGLAEHGRKLARLSDDFGFEIDPDELVWKLPMGMQQRVEILKALYHNAELLILDEPTSVLTPSETGPFFDMLGRLKAAEKTILFITHKLEEVMAISDRVTVMRGGKVTADVATDETNPKELARLMVGRDVVFDIERGTGTKGDTVLEVKHLRARSDRGLDALDDVSFAIAGGEILGIAGVDGNGQQELAEVIAGLRPLEGGEILVAGADITDASVARRRHHHGMGYVPEDRHRVGLVLADSVAANTMLRDFNRAPFSKAGWFDFSAIRRHAETLVERFDFRLQGIDQMAGLLSGGNQQKLILARELAGEPRVLVVAQPTKGLDVGAIEFVQKALLAQRARGAAILYISTELEHLLAVADRVAVIFEGRIVGVLEPAEATSERLGLLMAGAAA